MELNNIKAGTYTISASYSGDDNYFPCENNSIIIVNLRPNFINISIDNAYYGHMIVANVTTAGNGTIVLYINGKNKTYDLRYTHGLIYITNEFGDLKPGNWSVGVVYNEDEYFKYAINQTVFEVYKIDTPIEANATNITYGENEIINVTVDESATGYIAVRVGTDIHVLPLVNGTAKFNISGLAAGNYTALVVYVGDAIYNNATTTVSFKVGPTENYILDVKVDDIEYGQNATIRVLVPVLSGNVTINVDGKIIETVNVTNGTATLDVSGLAGGVHFVNVTYNGNEAFAPKDKNGTNFTVKPTTDWKMNITMTEPAIYGENTTIFISGLPDSAKNVTLRIDNINYTVNVTAGKANLTLNNLSVGVHPAVAIYEGDANYSYKEQIFRPHIIKATPTITLTEINGDVIATVSGNTTGNVTFYVNGKELTVNLTGRTAKLTADKLNIGINNIVAVYNGDANYTEARTTGNFTVDRLVSLVNVTANDTAYGKPVTVTVKVGKNQTGFVTIYVNGEEHSAKIKNQTATFTLRGLDIGRYRINVTYEGDNTFDVENNYTYFNVTKADLDVSVIAQNVTVKDNASFIIIVPADFDGKVNITVDNKTYTRDLINPVEIAKLLAGNKNATLLFYNSTKYADKQINVTFTVTRADPTINVRINDTTYPNKAVAEITVSDMANGTVKVIIGTQEFTGNVVNGTARVDLTGLSAGVKVADVRFTTTDDYNNNVTAKASFTVFRANGTVVINGVGNVTYEIGSVFTINATTNSTGMINIIVNGKSYAVLNNTNIALDSGKLAAGHYFVTAVVNETENYTKAIATVEFTIVKHAAVIDYVEVPKVNVTVGESVTVTVHMANVTSGSVLIEIGEHNYTVDIVNNYAVLTVKLPVGTYNATAYYLGDSNYTGDVKHNATLFNVTDKTAAWINFTDVHDIVVDSNITFQVTTNSNATLVVKVNGVEATYLGYGKYTFNGTAAGNYTITAEVKGNDYYTAAFNTTMFKVVKHNSTIHVDEISNHLVGDDFEITVSKNNTAFTVTINGVEYNVTKGVVKIDTTKLPAGQYIVTAIVKESDKYYGNSSTARFNITKNKSSVDVTTKDIKVGETARINITGPKDFNGTAIVNINGSSYNVVLTKGVGFVEVSNLANGTYNINVTYVENEKYLSSFNDSAVLNVSKWDKDSFDFTVRVVQNITAGQSAVLNITLPADATGNVTVKVAGINKTFAVMGGTNEIVIVGIPVGEYDVNVTYNGNEKYMHANASDKINVAPEIPTGFKVVDLRNGTVVVTVPANATGNITLKIGDHIYNATIVNSTAIINLNETPGIYYANVTYSGDEKHANMTVFEYVTIPKYATPITIDVNDSVVGNVTRIIVTVKGNVTNNVTIEIDGVKYSKKVTDNVTVFEIEGLTVGNKTVTATYGGDDWYLFNSTTEQFKVSKVASTVNVTTSPIEVGQTARINVTAPGDFNGTAVVTVNGSSYNVELRNGKGFVDVANLGNGSYTVYVTLLENGKYLSNKNSTKLVVSKVKAYIRVITQPIVVGDDEVILFELPSDATGTITVKINSGLYTAYVANGKASLTVPKLHAGIYYVNATYNGNAKYDVCFNDTESFKVVKHSVNMSLFDEGNRTIVIALHMNATGNVTVELGHEVYYAKITEDGIVTVTLVNATPGAHNVLVNFTGDNDWENQTGVLTIHVPKYDSPIGVSETNIKVSDKEHIEVTIPENATGRITIEVNGRVYNPISFNKGVAVFEIYNLTAGDKTFVVKYFGDENYTENTTSGKFSVTKYNSTVNVTTKDIKVGETVRINITGPRDYNGTAKVTINGTTYSVDLINGVGFVEVAKLANGTYSINVTYMENDKYLSSYNDTAVLNVSKWDKDSFVFNATVANITVGEPAVVNVTLPADATGNVTITIGNITKTVAILGGNNSIAIVGVPVGEHNVTVVYNGNDKYDKVNVTGKIKVSPVNTTEGNFIVQDLGNGTVIVHVPENATGNITIKIGNNNFTGNISDGKAVINLTGMRPGEYNSTIVYSGDENHSNVTFNATLHINKYETPITVQVGDIKVDGTAVVTVTVPKDVLGNVTIEIDGVKYNKTVDPATGVAVFEITGLTAGNKTATATYAGDKWYVFNSTTDQFRVSKYASSVNVTTKDIRVGETARINVTGPRGFNGTAKVNINGTVYSVTLTDGVGFVEVSNLANGTYNINVTYMENGKYFSSFNDSAVLNVVKWDNLSFEFTVNVTRNITLGEAAVINITLPGDATGNVTVKVAGITKTVAVMGGVNEVIIVGIPVGEYDVNVTYNGNDKYMPANASDKIVVSPAVPKDGFKVVDLRNGTVVVKVPENATGNITIKIGDHIYNATIKNSTAVIDLYNETPGTYLANVTYSGDANHTNMTVFEYVTIPKYETPIIIDVANSVVGDITRITVTVKGNVTNNVTIEIDGVKYNKTVTNNVTVFEIAGLTAGNKTVTATYDGDDWYVFNSTTTQFKVTKHASFVNVTTKDINVGETARINITGPRDFNGTAVVNINGSSYSVVLTNGIGFVDVAKLGNGTYSINVTYVENAKYYSSYNDTAVLVVSKYDKDSFVFNATVANITVGEPAVVNVTLPADATGNVTITIGNITKTVAILGGNNSIAIVGVPVGEHNVTVVYNGNEKYDKVNVTGKIKVSPVNTTEGNFIVQDLGNGTVIVYVPENATGNVTIKIGENNFTGNISDGKAVINLTGMYPGEYNSTVIYSGDENHSNVTFNATLHINKYETPITVQVGDIKVDGTAVVTVTVPKGVLDNVTIEIDGVKYNKTVTNGEAVFYITGLTAGNKTVTATYAGDKWYVFNSTHCYSDN